MAPGSWTLACLLLAVNAGAAPDEELLNFRQMSIPITIKPDRRGDVAALELWMSRDRGQNWEMIGRPKPDQGEFPYTAAADGPCWFSLILIDTKNQRDIQDVKQARVGLKVYIDTTRPEVKLTAERQGDEVVVNWEIREDHLDPKSLRVEWTQGGQAPTLAPITAGLRGQTRFKPLDPQAAVVVRMNAADLAKNEAMAVAEVPAQPLAPPGHTVSNFSASQPPTVLPETAKSPGALTPPWSPPPIVAPPPVVAPPPPNIVTPPPPVTTPAGTPRTIAQASGTGPGAPLATDYPPMAAVSAQMPPLQIINKRQVKLEFDVAKYGPSGLGAVDVYLTLDNGRTWEKAPVEPGAATLPADARGPGPLHGSVTVQLNKEAVPYGFYLVVKNRAGLGKPPPRPGDVPHLRVELDTTAPYAELLKPEPDNTQVNALVLKWTASDPHLAANPITWEWAARKEGPWQVIGEPQMPNTGRYVWRVTSDIPPNVFLRLTVRDTAGNTAVAETSEPETVDLTIPDIGGVGLQVGPK